MFNNAALDVVIGLVFIYLLYSLLGTLLQEIIAANIGLRGLVLRMAIRRMLNDKAGWMEENARKFQALVYEMKLIFASMSAKKEIKAAKDKDPKDPGKVIEELINKLSAIEKSKPQDSSRLSNAFYVHPLIENLRPNSFWLRKLPSYISNEAFSKVMIDLLTGAGARPGDPYRPLIQKSLDDGKIAWDENVAIEQTTLKYVRSLWADAQGDVQRFKELLDGWYTEMMRMTSGWFKKYTQLILLAVGMVIAIAFNVDTLKIADKLQKDPKARAAIVAQATEFSKAHPNLEKELEQQKADIDSLGRKLGAPTDSLKKNADSSYAQSRRLRDSLVSQASTLTRGDITQANSILGIGWEHGFWNEKDRKWRSLLGWLLTALAISLGAPFWFDLLNKLMKLRSSVSPDEGKTAKAGKSGNSPKQIERVG